MNNTTISNSTTISKYCQYVLLPQWVTILIASIYVLVIVCAAIENICVCIVIAVNKTMHSTTNFYLFSLAVSDLCQAAFHPSLVLLAVAYIPDMKQWNKGARFVWKLGIGTSTLTITMLTVERYMAICHPFHTLHLAAQKTRVILLIVAVWILSFLIRFIYEIRIIPHTPIIKRTVIYGTFYIIPVVVVTILCGLIIYTIKKSGRSARNTREDGSNDRTFYILGAIIITSFIYFIIPEIVRLSISLFQLYPKNNNNAKCFVMILYTLPQCLLTVIHPMIYSVISLNFRRAFKETFMRRTSRQNVTREVSLESVSQTPTKREGTSTTEETVN